MGRQKERSHRASHRGQAAALKVAGLGLAFVLLPHLLGHPPFAAAFRPLATLGWMLLVAGGLFAFLLRRSVPGVFVPTAGAPSPRFARVPGKPSAPVARGERIDSMEDTPAARQFIVDSAASSLAARMRPTSWGSNVFAVIEWRRFEAVVEALFAQAGFLTTAQSHGPDEGVDVWLYSKNQPGGKPVSVVQCKHWQKRRVGVDKVRELRGVMAAKGVTRGQFATTSRFTPDAIAFGTANGIKLHDGDGLLEVIATRTPEQQRALLDVALEGDYWRPTCVNCGIKMIERAPSAGGSPFWGCVEFPRCRTTMQMRAAARA